MLEARQSLLGLDRPRGGEIYKLMPKVMADITPIGKNQRVQSGPARFNFRGIDDVYNAVQQVLARHGVFTTVKIKDREHMTVETRSGSTMHHYRYHYVYRFWAPDGSFVDTESVGEAMDNGDKCANKCASISDKYALLQAFKIPTDETSRDPDAHTHEPQTAQPARPAPGPIQASQRLDYMRKWLEQSGRQPQEGVTVAQLVEAATGNPVTKWNEALEGLLIPTEEKA